MELHSHGSSAAKTLRTALSRSFWGEQQLSRVRLRRLCDVNRGQNSVNRVGLRQSGALDGQAGLPLYVPVFPITICATPRRRGIFEGSTMSFRCDLTGKKALVGHKVSHSNIKTKRRFLPNLCNVSFI
jgi:hypothetical protein